MYVELVEHSISNRGRIVPLTSVGTLPRNHESYMTLFPYDQSIYDHIKATGSVRGYSGNHHCPIVIIDIDMENDLEAALNSTRRLIANLYDAHRLVDDDLFIYFSGAKGFHLGIHEKALGGIPPSMKLPGKVKNFVKKITDGVEGIDLKIYEGNRLMRIANSVNQKKGLYKIPLHPYELQKGLEYVLDLAKSPRTDFERKKMTSAIGKNESLSDLFSTSNTDQPGNFQPKTSESSLFTLPTQGDRNNQFFKQACALFNRSQLSRREVLQIISAINSACATPLPDDEIGTIIESAATKTRHRDRNLDLRPFGGWLPAWYDHIRRDQNTLTLGMRSFDQEMNSKLRGKLCVLLGKGGAKKSLYAQNIAYLNEDARTIFSSMEMGATGIISRGIDMASDVGGININASRYLEDKEQSERGYAQKIIENDIIKMYGDRLLITQNTGLTTHDYYDLIATAESQYGKVDILIPDGLSMMGGNGTETELVSRHTKELKQLAIDKNIFVLLITHVTKEAEKTDRDLSKRARGSEKIIDNCDFFISMSLIKSTNYRGEEEYNEDYGFMRLVNKRGSGKTVDVIYQFDKKRLLMTQADIILENLENN